MLPFTAHQKVHSTRGGEMKALIIAGFLLSFACGVITPTLLGETLRGLWNRHREKKGRDIRFQRAANLSVSICRKLKDRHEEMKNFGRDTLTSALFDALFRRAALSARDIKPVLQQAKKNNSTCIESNLELMESKAAELHSVVKHMDSVEVSVSALWERIEWLVVAIDHYRMSLYFRIKTQRENGVCLGRELRLITRLGNLMSAYTVRTANPIDVLYRLSGMLVVLNVVHGQVYNAETGRPVRWKSYRRYYRTLSDSLTLDTKAVNRLRELGNADWNGIRFMLDLTARYAEIMRYRVSVIARNSLSCDRKSLGYVRQLADAARVCSRNFAANL
jgi:hypothetical protein